MFSSYVSFLISLLILFMFLNTLIFISIFMCYNYTYSHSVPFHLSFPICNTLFYPYFFLCFSIFLFSQNRYLLFAAEPYETIAFKVPALEIERGEGKPFYNMDHDTKIFTVCSIREFQKRNQNRDSEIILVFIS